MNKHLAKIREIALMLKEIIPICYISSLQHELDEIVAEVDAMKAILERGGL